MEKRHDIYDWLDRIERRPGMYLPEATMSRLASWLDGYDTALLTNSVDEEESPRFAGFVSFAAAALDVATTHGIEDVVRGNAETDEEAFLLFFELLHRYRGTTPPPANADVLQESRG